MYRYISSMNFGIYTMYASRDYRSKYAQILCISRSIVLDINNVQYKTMLIIMNNIQYQKQYTISYIIEHCTIYLFHCIM